MQSGASEGKPLQMVAGGRFELYGAYPIRVPQYRPASLRRDETLRIGGIPGNNELVLNPFDDFEASVADIVVSDGVMNTHIMGRARSMITA